MNEKSTTSLDSVERVRALCGQVGIELIAEERKRQILVECYSPEDDAHRYHCGELSDAAACYALRHYWRHPQRNPAFGMIWPWPPEYWKPANKDHTVEDRISELKKAGALIAAEIDRLVLISKPE